MRCFERIDSRRKFANSELLPCCFLILCVEFYGFREDFEIPSPALLMNRECPDRFPVMRMVEFCEENFAFWDPSFQCFVKARIHGWVFEVDMRRL